MPRLSLLALLLAVPAFAADPSPVVDFLKRPLLPADEATRELRAHSRPTVPRHHPPGSEQSPRKAAADWQKEAQRIRQDVLKNDVFRGEAAKSRDAKTKDERLDTTAMEGYRLKKLR